MSYLDYDEMLADMLAADHAPENVIPRAQAYTAELAATNAPTCCVLCLLDFAEVVQNIFETDRVTLERALQQCPQFWDACVGMLTAPRTDVDLDAIRGTLVVAMSSCEDMHRHPIDDFNVEDPVHVLIEATAVFVAAGIAFTVESDSPPFAGVNWPTSRTQVFPFGEKQCVDQLVSWCESVGAAPLSALGIVFAFDKDRLMDIVLHADNAVLRTRLLDVILRALGGNAPKSTLATDPRMVASIFLGQFLVSGGSREKYEQFTAGRRVELMHAYNSS